ncbi:MAG: hypothetical protein SCM96_02620 [Acidobacteriota bacterium]|nr:hypothetical protein [Acidobacteriota bacterium]
MKKWLEKSALLLVGILLALAGTEMISRVFWERITGLPKGNPISFVTSGDYENIPPGAFVWSGPLGAVKEFHNVSSRNRLGFHDYDYGVHKPDGTFRIVVVGDSFVEAKEVPISKNFAKILERKLNEFHDSRVEVLAFGRSGNGAVKNLEVLRDIGLCFQPDLVLMQFLSNDPIDDDPHGAADQKRQNALRKEHVEDLSVLYPRYLLLEKSRFNQILALKTARWVQGIQTRKHADLDENRFVHASMLIFSHQHAGRWKDAWNNSQKHILQARDISLEAGSEFLLVSFPEFWRMGDEKSRWRYVRTISPDSHQDDWDFDMTDRRLERFCQKADVPFLSLVHEFRREYSKSKKPFHFTYDMHLNERGHELAASILFEYIVQSPLLQ